MPHDYTEDTQSLVSIVIAAIVGRILSACVVVGDVWRRVKGEVR